GAVVGSFTSTDVDAGDTHTYTLVSGDGDTGNAAFTIDGNKLKTTDALNFEAQSSYEIRVRSTDQGGLSAEQTFTIDVTGVNEAPAAFSLGSSSVLQSQVIGTVVGVLSTIDPDAGNTHTYSLVSGEGDSGNGAFVIVDNELRTAQIFDFATQNSFSIRIRSTDQDGLFVEQVLTINILE
ncbi:MAG: cadherin repeat domain-containing protein, partial [Pirellulaceae bacterium]